MKDPLEQVTLDVRRAVTYVVLAGVTLVVLAFANPNLFGTIVVILAFFVMIMLHEFGHFVMAKRAGMKVTEFFVGFGPRIWSVTKGETEYGLKAFPLGGYCKIIGMTNLEEVDPEDEPRAYRSKRFLPKLSVILAGSVMHFLIALVLIFIVLFAAGNFVDATATTTVDSVTGPAGQALLHPGDRIVSIDGHSVPNWDTAVALIQDRPGQAVAVVVERTGEQVTLTVHLAAHRPDETARLGYAGIQPTVHVPHPGILASAALAPQREYRIGVESIGALGHIFSPTGVRNYVDNLSSKTPTHANDRFVSPVGFGRLANQAVRAGWVDTVDLLILINVFIGLFNLVPLLPFDGGHAAIATYEWIASKLRHRRVQVDVAKLMPLTLAVLAVLGFIFLSSLFLDLSHPISNPF